MKLKWSPSGRRPYSYRLVTNDGRGEMVVYPARMSRQLDLLAGDLVTALLKGPVRRAYVRIKYHTRAGNKGETEVAVYPKE